MLSPVPREKLQDKHTPDESRIFVVRLQYYIQYVLLGLKINGGVH
jgi:hypothetical protein